MFLSYVHYHFMHKIKSLFMISSQLLKAVLSVECLNDVPKINFLPVSVLCSESVFFTSFSDLIFPGFLLHYILSASAPSLQEKCKPS